MSFKSRLTQTLTMIHRRRTGQLRQYGAYVAIVMLISPIIFIPHGVLATPRNHWQHHFPTPPHVQEQVRFWEAIFHKYPSNTIVIHDTVYPTVVLDVINFKAFSKRYNNGNPYSRKEKNDLLARYAKRYRLAMERIAKTGRKALSHGAMEKRVMKVYSAHREAKKQLELGQAKIRGQSGLKDEFEAAARRASDYLPYMENIFRREGLPIELTRMAFVESMFNLNARSKVGASGIWQFMRSTGKLYMTVNRWIDERNSPIKATKGAAKLLKDNYSTLNSWPLAITAYNHGAGGMLRAIKRFRTRNIDTVIKRYKSNSFGFASRNFYSEFIAARNIYKRHFHRAGVRKINPMNLTALRMNGKESIASLLRYTPLNEATIKQLNQDLTNRAFTRNRNTPLPTGYELFIPKSLAQKVKYSLKKVARKRTTTRRG